VDQHRGRFAFPDAALQRTHGNLIDAMGQLLAVGGAAARSVISTIEGLRIHHLEAGAGRPLLLIHGASGGAANWYRVLPAVSQRRHVYSIDLPGFGLSETLEPKSPIGQQVAGLLLRWLDAQRIDRLSVVGTSFGGFVGLRLAQLARDRVEALAVIDSVGFGRSLPLALRLACLPLISAFALRPSRAGTRWQFEKLMMADSGSLPPAERAALLEYLWQSAHAANHARLARGFGMFTSLAGQREVLSDDELRALDLPVLILWGERDRFLPSEHADRAAALVPFAQCRIIPRAGHSPNWEAPAVVAESLNAFLPV
jgi:pimeloyl-ACP methyl ester carboxylesterase